MKALVVGLNHEKTHSLAMTALSRTKNRFSI